MRTARNRRHFLCTCFSKDSLRWENPGISDVPGDIHFTAVSGGCGNLSLDEAKLPSDRVIDYVRAWRRNEPATDHFGARTE